MASIQTLQPTVEDPTQNQSPIDNRSGAVNAHHPDYDDIATDWKLMRDSLAGEREVKEQGQQYLPVPSGFLIQDDGGKAEYNNYRTRAQFPRLVEPTLRGMWGVIHRKEADIKMPAAMEYLWEKATKDGLTLEGFHRRITKELLATGRYIVFVDTASTGDGEPWLAGYDAEHLINWSEFGDFYVLDETRLVRRGFAWVPRNKWRVLEMVDPVDPDAAFKPGDVSQGYTVTVYDGRTDPADAETFEPVARGGKTLEEIPLVVIGASDVKIALDEVPMLGVAQAAFAMYRLDADYRHQLYMSGQETFVCIKTTKEQAPRAVGASVILTLPDGADAKYVSPTCKGIEAHRLAIQDEAEKAASAGARLFDNAKKAAESGDALKIRFAGQTATLTSIAISSAAGLERALKYVATFMGLNPDDVVVTPNLSFIDATLTGVDALNLVKIWQANVISKQTLYEALQRGEIASTERSFEDEQALIEDELPPPTVGGLMLGAQVPGMVPPLNPNSPAPTDQQLNAFRAGQKGQATGKKPPPFARPGTQSVSNVGQPPSKKVI